MAGYANIKTWMSKCIPTSIMLIILLGHLRSGEGFKRRPNNAFPKSQPSYRFQDIHDVPVHLRERPGVEDIYNVLSSPEYSYILNERVLFTQNRPLPRLKETMQLTTKDKLKQNDPLSKWNPYEGIFKRQSVSTAGIVPIEACPSNSQWVHITEGRTLNNTMVELLDVQWFWVTDCVNSGTACQGFTGRSSSCLPKHSWVPAYARESGTNTEYSWYYISIASCCACAVKLT